MKYAVISDLQDTVGTVGNVIDADAKGAADLADFGLLLVPVGSLPVAIGDACNIATGVFYRDGAQVVDDLTRRMMDTQTDLGYMLVDQEYRLTLLELGVTM